MTIIPFGRATASPVLGACLVVLRAATGLFAHGLARPGRPALIDRRTGRVRPQ